MSPIRARMFPTFNLIESHSEMIRALSLKKIRSRCAQATPGPWIYKGSGFIETVGEPNRIVGVTCLNELQGDMLPADANGEFVASARTDIPLLLAEVQRLRTALGQIAAGEVPVPEDFAREALGEEAVSSPA